MLDFAYDICRACGDRHDPRYYCGEEKPAVRRSLRELVDEARHMIRALTPEPILEAHPVPADGTRYSDKGGTLIDSLDWDPWGEQPRMSVGNVIRVLRTIESL